jgi:hypothetical protein
MNPDSPRLHLQERGVAPSSYGSPSLTSRILDRGSRSRNERPVADWPLPPGYSGMHGDNSNEVDDLRPATPHIKDSAPPQGPAPVQAAPTREPFVYPFYKPRNLPKRRYYIAFIVFLLILVGVLATVFGIKKEHMDKIRPPSPANSVALTELTPLATTLVSTEVIPTTLISTEFTSPFSIPATTISEVSTTTQVTTQPTTIIESTTIIHSTTVIESNMGIESTTQAHSLALTQLSTVTQIRTLVPISTLTTSFPSTSIQSTTVTRTTTVVITLTHTSTKMNGDTLTFLRSKLSTERLSRTSVMDLFKTKVSTIIVGTLTRTVTTKSGIPSAAVSSTAGR